MDFVNFRCLARWKNIPHSNIQGFFLIASMFWVNPPHGVLCDREQHQTHTDHLDPHGSVVKDKKQKNIVHIKNAEHHKWCFCSDFGNTFVDCLLSVLFLQNLQPLAPNVDYGLGVFIVRLAELQLSQLFGFQLFVALHIACVMSHTSGVFLQNEWFFFFF